jgi:glutamate carboxypeptidase
MAFDNETMAAALTEWVAVESHTYDPAGVNRMMDCVVASVAGMPIAVERVAGRDGLGDMITLRAGPQNGKKPVLILSHLDTVHPRGTLAQDLPIKRDGDRLYGPGIYDMKGGAFLALEAFKQVVADAGAQVPLVFMFTPDEEIGSPISRAAIEAEGRKAEAVLVTEPARDGGKIVTARKGVGRFDVQVEGRPAHSGTSHEKGRNAIAEAAKQILAIQAMTDYARGVTTTVGMIKGGTAANTIPQHCSFCVDLRVRTVADGEEFTQKILGLTASDPAIQVRVTGDMNRPPFEKTPQVAGLFERARGIAKGLGIDLVDVPQTGGGSDGNFTAVFGVPTLDGLGCDGDGAHTLQEYALISSLGERALLMDRLLRDFH